MAAGRDQTVEVDGRTIKLTNLDKILYPETGTTKADVLSYYARIGPTLLGHVYERPATRKRWPDGIGTGDPSAKAPIVFFNKDLAKGTPDWVARHKIAHKDHDNYYPVINDLATLTWLAQLASLEIHVPQWRFGHNGQPRNPDRLVLDLDPGPGVSLTECAQIARACREILRDIGHDPTPVTSGSKGIHLYAPLDGSLSPEDATAVARELARALEADQPDLVISQMKRSERDGKVFIDWSQNNGNKTTVAPYSLRGRDHPTVAAPRTWDELESDDLRQLTYEEVLERLDDLGDPLASMADPEASTPASPDRLTTYRSMRDARKTPEPVPIAPSRDDHEGFSFVIQEHHARRLHYDFRLQHHGVLVSWAVPKGPPTETGSNHLAVQTEDHPLEYGTFEGTIPKGEYGGGEVTIWDAGTYELHKWRDGKEVIITLHGRDAGGLGGVRTYALIHTNDKNWLMHLMKTDPSTSSGHGSHRTSPDPSTSSGHGSHKTSPDPSTSSAHGLRETSTDPSTNSGRGSHKTSPELVEGPIDFPEHIDPMLATLTDEEHFGSQEGWAFEMKWDGVRTIAYLAGGRVQLLSRKGRDDTAAYFDVVDDLAALDVRTAVLDGEVVVADSTGRPDFGLLQGRINLTRPADIERAAKTWPAQLMIFDLLELNGESMINLPYDDRRAALEALVQPRKGSRIQVPPIFDGDLHAAKAISEELRLEGIVAKRRSSVYVPGRRAPTWLKIKNQQMQEVVIGGWRPGQGRRDGGVGSLLLGVPTAEGLRYVGRVGSGFNDRMLDELQKLLAPLTRKTTPLTEVPREDARDAHWVTPSLVGEVAYSELTGPGRLRHPVWRGLRTDKSADEVVWEGLAGALDAAP